MPMTGPSGVAVGLPMFCNSDKMLFLRLVTQTAFLNVFSISGDGKTVTHFDKGKITDIPNPRVGTFFVSGSDVYIEVVGLWDPQPRTLVVPHKDGTTTQEKTVQYRSMKTYVAHFKSDGSYIGAVPLEIDFRLLKFGVFPTGEILVAGIRDGPGEPRVALLQGNGQMLRYLDLEEDVQPDAPQFTQDPEPAKIAADAR